MVGNHYTVYAFFYCGNTHFFHGIYAVRIYRMGVTVKKHIIISYAWDFTIIQMIIQAFCMLIYINSIGVLNI